MQQTVAAFARSGPHRTGVRVAGRAAHRRDGRHPREEVMQVPKVIEIRRGSAHRSTTLAPIAAAAASGPHRDGGSRSNSGI